jgi:hypothetical protein
MFKFLNLLNWKFTHLVNRWTVRVYEMQFLSVKVEFINKVIILS